LVAQKRRIHADESLFCRVLKGCAAMKKRLVVFILIVSAAVAVGSAQTHGVRERYTAFAVNLDSSPGARQGAGTVELVVNAGRPTPSAIGC